MSHTSPSAMRIPGPPFVAKLSSFDCRHSFFFSRRILIFRTTSSPEELTEVVVRATRLLVQTFPFLAGQAALSQSPAPTGQSGWKEITPGSGVTITTRDVQSQLSYGELEEDNFPPSSLKHDDLIPLPLNPGPEPYDIAHFRLNFVRGGLLLAVCIAHIVADGVGQSEILRVFASYCKLVSDLDAPALDHYAVGEPLGLDRSSLVGLNSPLSSIEHHPAMIQSSFGFDLQAESYLPAELIRLYRVGATNLARLKQDATTDMRISTSDAVMALIWRSVMKSRVAAGVIDSSGDVEVTLYMPVSLRRTLGLGDKYIGNAVCNRIVRQPLSQLLRPLPEALQSTARLIRAEISRVDGDLARGYAQLSDSAPSVTDFIFGGLTTIKSTSIVISSLYNMNKALMSQDWGSVLGNRLARFRCTDRGYAAIMGGTNFILPSSELGEDGGSESWGAEVQVSCYPGPGVEALDGDDGWRRYCDPA